MSVGWMNENGWLIGVWLKKIYNIKFYYPTHVPCTTVH